MTGFTLVFVNVKVFEITDCVEFQFVLLVERHPRRVCGYKLLKELARPCFAM